jgi:hypothetical protein
MIKNLGKPVNPINCDHRIFLVKTHTITEVSFDEQQKINHEAFEKCKPYPNYVLVNDKAVCFERDDESYTFVRKDLDEILAACPINHKEEITKSEAKPQ